MGLPMSFMGGKGLSTSSYTLNVMINTLYKQFVEKDINTFDGFHIAILDIFNIIKMALPGKHYDAPSLKDVKDLFKQWKVANNEESRKNIFKNFMKKNVNLNKIDKSMIITGIVAPPAAMVAKRKGQTVPQLKLMKSIPDVVFVPSATFLAIITVKILRLISMGKIASRDHIANGSQLDHVVQNSNSDDIPPPPPQAEPSQLPPPPQIPIPLLSREYFIRFNEAE